MLDIFDVQDPVFILRGPCKVYHNLKDMSLAYYLEKPHKFGYYIDAIVSRASF